MRLSGLRASGNSWACHYCSCGLGDTVRSSRGSLWPFPEQGSDRDGPHWGMCICSGSAVECEVGGPACWPWDALRAGQAQWPARRLQSLDLWTRGRERLFQLPRMPRKPQPKWNHLGGQRGFVESPLPLRLRRSH